MEYKKMFNIAKELLNPIKISNFVKISDTVCVMECNDGTIYKGVSLVARCGLGYCSEQACITQMINDGKNNIKCFLTMNKHGVLIPPCGRCIELMLQINSINENTEFYINEYEKYKIKDIFKYDWKNISY